MDGIHDMGGMHGFGRIPVEHDEPVFQEPWHGRVRAMVGLLLMTGLCNVDAFRHAIERLAPPDYLTVGYFGRWLAALEALLVERGKLTAEERASLPGRAISSTPSVPPVPARAPGSLRALRSIAGRPRFALGQRVRARDLNPRGHTRLPGYVRGRAGVVALVHPAFVFPDTNAHGLGENPQHVYAVRFEAREVFGDSASERAAVHVDLFESYLEALP